MTPLAPAATDSTTESVSINARARNTPATTPRAAWTELTIRVATGRVNSVAPQAAIAARAALKDAGATSVTPAWPTAPVGSSTLTHGAPTLTRPRMRAPIMG